METPCHQPTILSTTGSSSYIELPSEDDTIESQQIPSFVFFDFYAHQISPPGEKLIPAPTLIVDRAAKHLARYVNASPVDLFSHLCNLYNHFHLDEEVFITAMITLYRYMGALGTKLVLNNISELFYLLVLCMLISVKALHDHPLNMATVARTFGLDVSRLAFNEHQILVSLNYSLFFHPQDLVLKPEELALIAAEQAGTVAPINHRRGSLLDIFPEEGYLCLSYSSDKPARPSLLVAWTSSKCHMAPQPQLIPVLPPPPPAPTSAGASLSAETASQSKPDIRRQTVQVQLTPSIASSQPQTHRHKPKATLQFTYSRVTPDTTYVKPYSYAQISTQPHPSTLAAPALSLTTAHSLSTTVVTSVSDAGAAATAVAAGDVDDK